MVLADSRFMVEFGFTVEVVESSFAVELEPEP